MKRSHFVGSLAVKTLLLQKSFFGNSSFVMLLIERISFSNISVLRQKVVSFKCCCNIFKVFEECIQTFLLLLCIWESQNFIKQNIMNSRQIEKVYFKGYTKIYLCHSLNDSESVMNA